MSEMRWIDFQNKIHRWDDLLNENEAKSDGLVAALVRLLWSVHIQATPDCFWSFGSSLGAHFIFCGCLMLLIDFAGVALGATGKVQPLNDLSTGFVVGGAMAWNKRKELRVVRSKVPAWQEV